MPFLRLLALLLSFAFLVPAGVAQDSKANSLPEYLALRHIALSGEAVGVNNLVLKRDLAVFKFNQGTFHFVAPVAGRITGAVFVGEGTLSLDPESAQERRSLSLLTKDDEFVEHFNTLVLRFTDKTADEIKAASTPGQASGSAAGLLHDSLDATRLRLHYNLSARILADLLSVGDNGLFVAFIQGRTYNKKMIFFLDPNGAPAVAPDEISLVTYDEAKLGIWASFRMTERRDTNSASRHGTAHVQDQKLDTFIDKSGYLRGKAITTATVRGSGLRAIPFELYPTLRVQSVTSNGTPLNFIQEDKKDDPDFWVILPQPMADGENFTIQTVYEGKDAIRNEGAGNYFPLAREDWYPSTYFGDYANYEMTFHIPAKLTMVATGKLVSEKEEDGNVTVWRSEVPMPVAGFNFGKFKKAEAKLANSEFLVESYANEAPPDSVARLTQTNELGEFDQHGLGINAGAPMALGSMSTVSLMKVPLAQAQIAVGLYSDYFGPTPFSHLAMTQQTACGFGQSWPNLVYLPICAYFDSTVRHQLGLDDTRGYWENVAPHEVAHQWWGHTVGFASYRDQWMSEGFAEFSASLYVQATNKDTHPYLKFWNDERSLLTERNSQGFRAIDVGPVTLGYRSDNSRAGFNIARRLIYPKGGYILHMIRMMMWDPKRPDVDFKDMMHDFVQTYRGKAASTEDFKRMVEKHITPNLNVNRDGKVDWFFNEYVYGTALPSYGFTYSIDGKTLSFKATQSNVDEKFVMPVPVYLELDTGHVMRLGMLVMRGNSSVDQKVDLSKLSSGVKRAMLNYYDDVLAGN